VVGSVDTAAGGMTTVEAPLPVVGVRAVEVDGVAETAAVPVLGVEPDMGISCDGEPPIINHSAVSAT
jgi:hypothetical protein